MARSQPKEAGPKRIRSRVSLRARVNSPSVRNAARLSARGQFSGGKAKTRTVVKAKYTRMQTKGGSRSKQGVSRIKAAASYMAHRPNEHGEREYRPAFTPDAELEKAELNAWLEQPSGSIAYRMVLSPGVQMDADSIMEWTRDTLERAGITEYVGFAHAGESAHTPHAHVHVIAYTDALLNRHAFAEVRSIGDDQAKWQHLYDVADDLRDFGTNVVESVHDHIDF